VHELEKKQGIFEGIWSRMRPAGEMRFRLKYEFLRWKVAIRGSKIHPIESAGPILDGVFPVSPCQLRRTTPNILEIGRLVV
jgi:hypothetical protein